MYKLLALLFLPLLYLTAGAQSLCALTVALPDAAAGTQLQAYVVAWPEENGQWAVDTQWGDIQIPSPQDPEALRQLAGQLEIKLSGGSFYATGEATVQKSGRGVFSSLSPGLYLITGGSWQYRGKEYQVQSFLLFLTEDVTVQGKYTAKDLPTLPQTGALWWPVPGLVCIGLALLLSGRKRDEG